MEIFDEKSKAHWRLIKADHHDENVESEVENFINHEFEHNDFTKFDTLEKDVIDSVDGSIFDHISIFITENIKKLESLKISNTTKNIIKNLLTEVLKLYEEDPLNTESGQSVTNLASSKSNIVKVMSKMVNGKNISRRQILLFIIDSCIKIVNLF